MELRLDQHELGQIKEQQSMVGKIQSVIAKKDKEISSLKSMLDKYQIYQQKYSSLKL